MQSKAFYIKSLRLKNVRVFDDLELNFLTETGKPRMRTVIIGRNETGKTSLLRAIALGLSNKSDAESLLSTPSGNYIGPFGSSAKIEIEALEPSLLNFVPHHFGTTIEGRFREKEILQEEVAYQGEANDDFNCFLPAFGTPRAATGSETSRSYRLFDSVQTLFRNDATLFGTELTLRRLGDFLGSKMYENAIWGIKRALKLSDQTRIELAKGGGVIVKDLSMNRSIPLEGWADGYRKTFQWIVDLYAQAINADQLTESGGIRGIVLIDEIEQHLHPSLQISLFEGLGELFPELQIIATTHSPMVTMSVKPEELIVLRYEDGRVHSVKNVPNYRGYSIEDIIADDLLFNAPIFSLEQQQRLEAYHRDADKILGERSIDSGTKVTLPDLPTNNNEDELIRELRKIQEKL